MTDYVDNEHITDNTPKRDLADELIAEHRADAAIEDVETIRYLTEIQYLTEIEERIYVLHRNGKTLTEIAELLDIDAPKGYLPKDRVRQIEAMAMAKLRHGHQLRGYTY